MRFCRHSGFQPATGRRIIARRPPIGLRSSEIDPPYSSTRRCTIASPRPEPDAVSSARTPRCSTDLRSGWTYARTVIFETIMIISRLPTWDDRATRVFAHLHALSRRFPRISSRSSRSTRTKCPPRLRRVSKMRDLHRDAAACGTSPQRSLLLRSGRRACFP